MSIVESDRPPSCMVSWCEQNWGEYKMPVGRGDGVRSVGWGGDCRDLHHPFPRAFCTLPSLARIKRPRWRPVGLNNRHLRSNGKIGDCEQSTTDQIQARKAKAFLSALMAVKQALILNSTWIFLSADCFSYRHDVLEITVIKVTFYIHVLSFRECTWLCHLVYLPSWGLGEKTNVDPWCM